MASTLVALQTVTVGAGGAANISFTNIPQTYNDLVVKWSARAAGAYGPIETEVTFNGNVSAGVYLYSQRNMSGYAGSVYSASTTNSYRFNLQYATGNSATANTFSNNEIYITNYANNSQFKSVSFESASENNATTEYILGPAAGLWAKTDAVTSITIQSNGVGNWMQYSTFTLYGVYNSPLDTAVEAPTIGTATAASTGANVAFTPSGTGAPATSYVATSSPGGITATGYTSPILVTGLTSGTAYTFTVRGQNPGGTGAASAASNSVTPYDGYESIATVVVGSGGSSSISFSSIPSTYTHLQIRGFSRQASTNNIRLEFNSDSSANYASHYLQGGGSSTEAYAYTGQTSNLLGNSASGTSIFSGTVIDVLDYANTNKNKTTRTLNGWDANGSGMIGIYSGLWPSTSAITTVRIWAVDTFQQYSVFELYGIRG